MTIACLPRYLPRLIATSLTALLLVACGDSDTGANTVASHDNSAEVQAYYEANPDFFRFRTAADLPGNLDWQNGSGLAEMGSPEAKKGGTEYRAIQDFPRTLRTIGPDSNGGFRGYLLDNVAMKLAWLHQDEPGFIPGLANEWALGDDGTTVYVRLDPRMD